MNKFLILKRKTAGHWALFTEEGTMLFGPYRWGTLSQALDNACAFASTWPMFSVLSEEEYEARRQDPVPKQD